MNLRVVADASVVGSAAPTSLAVASVFSAGALRVIQHSELDPAGHAIYTRIVLANDASTQATNVRYSYGFRPVSETAATGSTVANVSVTHTASTTLARSVSSLRGEEIMLASSATGARAYISTAADYDPQSIVSYTAPALVDQAFLYMVSSATGVTIAPFSRQAFTFALVTRFASLPDVWARLDAMNAIGTP
jgi:hypothetical protein